MSDQSAQQNNAKLVRASARGLKIAPRKMRLVTNLVKNLRVSDALTQLHFTNKKAAGFLSTLLRSAVANAENNFSINSDNLVIKSVTCDMGQTMKRYFPRARGSAFIIRRKMSNVNVVLEEIPAKNKSRFRLPANTRSKSEKPTITQEGSAGIPEMSEKDMVIDHPTNKDLHHENEAAAVAAKSGVGHQQEK